MSLSFKARSVFPVREVSGIGLQPRSPSDAAQPPSATTESAPFRACASSVCIYIALHIERLTGLSEQLRDDLPRRLVHTYRIRPVATAAGFVFNCTCVRPAAVAL